MNNTSTLRPPTWWWAVFLTIIVLAGALRFTGYRFSLPYVDHPDEPNWNLSGRMIIDAGSAKPLGFHGYPPGIITINYVLLRFFHDPATPPATIIPWVRLLSITVSLGTVAIVGLLGYHVATPLAGLLAAGLWGIMPQSVEFSRYATADPYTTFFTVLAVFLAFAAMRHDRDRWASWAVVANMLAIVFKYQAVFIVPLVLALPLWRLRIPGCDKRRILASFRDNAIYLALFFFWLLAIYPATEADDVPYWVAPTNSIGFPDWDTLHYNLRLTVNAFWPTPGWVAGCLGLLLLVWVRDRVDVVGLIVVVLSAAAWWVGVSFFGMQAERQFVALGAFLTVILAAGLAGWAGALAAVLAHVHHLPPRVRRGQVSEALVASIVFAAGIPLLADSIENAYQHTLPDRRNDLAAYMDTSLAPGPYISSDDNHKTFNRDWGGYGGDNEFRHAGAMNIMERSIAEWREQGIMYAIMPCSDYEAMQQTAQGREHLTQMLLLKLYPPSKKFRGPDMAVLRLSPIEHQATGTLGPIHLVGYDIDRTAVTDGETVTFTLYWQATGTPDAEYSVYNHLVPIDSREIMAQVDGPPLVTARRPTTQWDDPAETLVSRPFTLAISADVPPGEYRLITGFYRPDSWERLRSPSGDDFVTVTTIRVR
jgi:hypothetical protein